VQLASSAAQMLTSMAGMSRILRDFCISWFAGIYPESLCGARTM